MNTDLQDALLDLLVRRLDSGVSGAALVDWATRAVEQAVESESLILLAGLARDCSVYEAGPLLDRGLAELNVTVPGEADLRRAYVGVLSRAFLADMLNAEELLERVHHSAVTPLGHPPDLAPWCFVWEGLDPADFRTLEPNEVEDYTLRLAQTWATQPERSRVGDFSGRGGS